MRDKPRIAMIALRSVIFTLGGRFPRARPQLLLFNYRIAIRIFVSRYSRWSRHPPFQSLKLAFLFTFGLMILSVIIRVSVYIFEL